MLSVSLLLIFLAEIPLIENDFTAESPQTIIFRENLRIGAPDYFFVGVAMGVDADAKGNIYITDVMGWRVLVFDPNGRFLRQIGRKGSGPGEFINLQRFQILEDQSMVGIEWFMADSYLLYFDQDGKFVRKQTNKGRFLLRGVFAPDGLSLMGFTQMIRTKAAPAKERIWSVDLLTPDLELIKHFSTHHRERTARLDPEYYIYYVANHLRAVENGEAIFAFKKNGDLFVGKSNEYNISLLNGKTLQPYLRFLKKYKPTLRKPANIRIMREELSTDPNFSRRHFYPDDILDQGIEKAQVKEVNPVILELISMENGGLLVIRDMDLEKMQVSADYFDDSGQFRGEVGLPPITTSYMGGVMRTPTKLVFKNGQAYALEADEDFEYTLVRYDYEVIAK